MKSALPKVSRGVTQLYSDFQLSDGAEFVDFHIELASPSLVRRHFRPQVQFSFDGKQPFKPLPIDQAFAMFEWGLNWVIANHVHQFAIVHAATIEKNGRAVILPGAPGSGKSTLCAAMVCQGWRLLSDEMAMISLADGLIWPIPRPVSLKNASIGIIQGLGNEMVFGDIVAGTAKGSVTHMRPPKTSVEAVSVPANPFAIVFPTYQAGASTAFQRMSRGRTLMRLAETLAVGRLPITT